MGKTPWQWWVLFIVDMGCLTCFLKRRRETKGGSKKEKLLLYTTLHNFFIRFLLFFFFSNFRFIILIFKKHGIEKNSNFVCIQWIFVLGFLNNIIFLLLNVIVMDHFSVEFSQYLFINLIICWHNQNHVFHVWILFRWSIYLVYLVKSLPIVFVHLWWVCLHVD